MKKTAAILSISVAALASSFIGRAFEPGNEQVDERQEPRTYLIDVERPFAFLRERLPNALKRGPNDLLGVDALDGVAKVRLARDLKSTEMEVELITGAERPNGKGYSIYLAGVPATLDDTYALALRLCDIAKIPNNRISAWYKEKKYESPLGSAQLQSGRESGRLHEIEVRSSLELSGDKQWRVVYEIYFPATERASDEDKDNQDDIGRKVEK